MRQLVLLSCLVAAFSCAPTSGELVGLTATGTTSAAETRLPLPKVGALVVPAGALPAGEVIELKTTALAPTAARYELLVGAFTSGQRAAYEVRVVLSAVPSAPVTLELDLPSDLGDAASTLALVNTLEGNDLDQVERFVPSQVTVLGPRQLGVAIAPSRVFSSVDEGAAPLEAVVVLARIADVADFPSFTKSSSPLTSREDLLTDCPPGLKKLQPPLDQVKKIRGYSDVVTTIGSDTITGHPGVDLEAPDGTAVRAAGEGKVIRAVDSNGQPLKKDNGGAGGMVQVDIPGSGIVTYMHLKQGEIKVKVGDTVEAGQVIALSNNSGFSTGPHLHFELRPRGENQRISPDLCFEQKRTQRYTLRYTHSETVTDSAGERRYAATATGTANVTFVAERPAIPAAGAPAAWSYLITDNADMRINSFDRREVAGTTCSTYEATPETPTLNGTMDVYPEGGQYKLAVSMSAGVVQSCVTGATPNRVGTLVFASFGYNFAYDCKPNASSSPQFPADFKAFNWAPGSLLDQAHSMRCTGSGSTYDISTRWSLDSAP